MQTISSTSSTTWNGGTCSTCGALWINRHECSVMDLVRRADELRDMALKKFEALNPQPTTGSPAKTCPCRPENGGSGVCGCTLGGPKVTC